MTVKTYLDITVAPFTANGAPAKASSLHARGDTYDFDRVNDWLSSSEAVNANGATKINFRGWLNTKRLAPTAGQSMLNTRPTAGTGNYFYVNINNAQQLQFVAQNSTAFTQSLSSALVPAFQRVYISGSMDLGAVDVDLYVNGVEMSYSIQNGTFGGGVASLTNGTLGISSDFNNSFSSGMLGSLDRLVFEDGVFWTPAQHAQFYADEVAAMVRLDECEDHQYLCDDAATQLSDSVGNAHMSSGNLPNFNDPVAGKCRFTQAGSDHVEYSSNPIADSRGDYSAYGVFQLPNVQATTRRFFRPTYADGSFPGPWINLVGSGANFVLNAFAHGGGGGADVSVDSGVAVAAVTDAITWAFGLSYVRATKTMTLRLRSSTGVNVTGSNVGTVHSGFTSGNGHIMANTTDFSTPIDMILDQFGVKNGIAYTDAKLLAALESLMPAVVAAGITRQQKLLLLIP